MKKFAKFIFVSCMFLFSLNFLCNDVLAGKYKAKIFLNRCHINIIDSNTIDKDSYFQSKDSYSQFDVMFYVENDKGKVTYFVDILKNNAVPKFCAQNFCKNEVQVLLDKCKNNEIELGKELSVEIDRTFYWYLFNLTKTIKSKSEKFKNSELKAHAFNSLVPKVLSIFNLNN